MMHLNINRQLKAIWRKKPGLNLYPQSNKALRCRLKISIFSDGIFFSKLNNSILNFYAKIMTNKSFFAKE
jgi:hypothetical protein